MSDAQRPLLAPPDASPAEASRPDVPLEAGRWHIYESNPVPWWVTLLWLWFFSFAILYLLKNLID